MTWIITFFSLVGLTLAVSAEPQAGQPAPDFTATDINGRTVSLSDYSGKIVVIEAHDSTCPWTAQEYQSGAIQELQRQLTAAGVIWLILDPGVQTQLHIRETPAEAKGEWVSEKMAITDWIIDDTRQSVSKRYGIRVTPQMVVIDKAGIVAYTGAIDDAQTLDGDRRTAHNYVRQAVTELLAGKDVSVPHVKPFGCMIMYPGMTQFQLMRPMN